MKILVFGGSGQVGSVVLETIRRDHPGAEVVGIQRSAVGGSHIRFDAFADDWTKLPSCDVLVNCLGIIEERKGLSFYDAHLGLTRKILEHRVRMGSPRVIQLSVLGAEKDLPSAYIRSKAEADKLLLAEENTYVLRPSLVCTNNTMIVQKFRMLGRVAKRFFGTLPFPSGFLKSKMQPVMGEDVAAAISMLCSVNFPHRVIELAGPDRMKIAEILSFLRPAPRILPIPQTLVNGLFSIAGGLFPRLINRDQFALLQEDNVSDQDHARKLLGRPLLSTKDFWSDQLA